VACVRRPTRGRNNTNHRVRHDTIKHHSRMFRVLDLIWTLTKCCLVLTLVRLLASAFGCEFGISRQYLRLLEWVLRLGKERIERCESEHRMQQELMGTTAGPVVGGCQMEASGKRGGGASPAPTQTTATARPKPPAQLDLDESAAIAVAGGGGETDRSNLAPAERDDKSTTTTTKAPRRVGLALADLDGPAKSTEQRRTSQRPELEHQKRRRVSTPDGPPIFLFDDEDDDDNDDDLDELARVGEHVTELCRGKCSANGNRSTMGQEERKHEFNLDDAARLVVRGLAAIIDDEVTKRFTHEQLETWNLLTRNNAKNYQFMSRSLGFCWLAGLIIRYAILMPLRIMFTMAGFVWLITTMPIIGLLPKWPRDKLYRLVSLMAFRMLSCGINSRLKFHNRQFRARGGSICVANHTSPLDVVLLASDNCYTLVGQRHGGLLGLLQVVLSRAANHIWFERSEMRDRKLVAARLRKHVNVSSNLPVLIFPEGTCINNSAVMMFRKGSFEVTDRIYPVAIKYDPRFGDPFWNSSKQSYVQYLLMIMSAWAIKCEVWYLQPMDRLEGESSAEFANRVKAEIARQAGLEDLAWDGQLKRSSVKPTWLYQQQEDYVRRLKLE
jgi:glycerol-3-phosphate O-acyltransferase 3/4